MRPMVPPSPIPFSSLAGGQLEELRRLSARALLPALGANVYAASSLAVQLSFCRK